MTIRRVRAVRRPARDDESNELLADRLWALGAQAVVVGDGEVSAGFASEELADAAARSTGGEVARGEFVEPVFGDGGHPSTLACLTALEDWVGPRSSVLDVGTGSGVLARRALDLGAERVVAVDTSPAAVDAARARGLPDVRLGSVDAAGGSFDIVVANLGGVAAPAALGPQLAARVAPHGVLIVGGLLADVDSSALDEAVACDRLQRGSQWLVDGWVAVEYHDLSGTD